MGLFPKSYIHLKDLAKVDPVVGECTLVLREWSEIWKKLFVVSLYLDGQFNILYCTYILGGRTLFVTRVRVPNPSVPCWCGIVCKLNQIESLQPSSTIVKEGSTLIDGGLID